MKFLVLLSCVVMVCTLLVQAHNIKVLYVYYCAGELLSTSHNKISLNRLRGSEVSKINLYKNVKQYGIDPIIILGHDFDLKSEFEQAGACCYEIALSKHAHKEKALAECIQRVCVKEKIDIIHCNSMIDVCAAKEAAKKLPVRIVVTLHTDRWYQSPLLKGLDAAICVGVHAVDLLVQANLKQNFGIRHIVWIPPFYDEEIFLRAKIARTQKQFFVDHWKIVLPENPTVCMIANFYQHSKNHNIVLQAARRLKENYRCPINLIFAGGGSDIVSIKMQARALRLSETTFFLGNVANELIPELLFHSDIEVLMSFSEAFGIVLLEGALMKKPLIGTRGTGMESVIKHEQTGFLCDVSDVDTLAQQILFFVRNPLKAQEFGQRAYDFVTQQLNMHAGMCTLKKLYKSILDT